MTAKLNHLVPSTYRCIQHLLIIFYFSSEHTPLNPRAHPQKAWGTPTHPPGVPPCQPLHSEAGREPARGAIAESISPTRCTRARTPATHAREQQRESISEQGKRVILVSIIPASMPFLSCAMLCLALYDTKCQQCSFLPYRVHKRMHNTFVTH